MKLKTQIYSQRNSQWGNELLGFNTNSIYNIANYGCLITVLGDYINKNPHEVNDILKANGGFAAGGGLFNWSKSTVLGLTNTYTSPEYLGPVTSQGLTKIKESLDNGFPLICEIDFNPATEAEEMHYVLIHGYDGEKIFACDPWTGTEIDLDIYGGPKRAIIQFRAYSTKLPVKEEVDLQAELDKVRTERDRNWGWFIQVCDALGVGANVDAAVNEAQKLVDNDDALVQKDKQLQEAQSEIWDLKTKLKLLTENNLALQGEQQKLSELTSGQQGMIDDQAREIKELSKSIQELEDQSQMPVLVGWKAWLYEWLLK